MIDNGALTPSTKGAIAAVVINHNAGKALIECIASLRESGIDEIVVVDNSSSDGSLAKLAEVDKAVTLIPTGRNPGYGAAANIGVARTSAEYVLVCNPDLLVEKDAPATLAKALFDHSEVAIVGPRTVNQTGALYPSARSFPQLSDAVGHAFVGLFWPQNRWSERYRDEMTETGAEREVDWVSGACFMTRRIAFLSVSGFDEHYFMYVEDMDLCWRLRRGGWQTRYVPNATVIHEQGVSSKDHPYRLLVAHHQSTWRFARRSAPKNKRLLLPIIGSGIGVRLVLALCRSYLKAAKPKLNR